MQYISGGIILFEYIIIADDFTGANETAVKFMNVGHNSSVILEADSLPTIQKNYSTVALDTESFHDTPVIAAKKLRNLAKYLIPWKDKSIFYKRINPNFQGNAAIEIKSFAERLGFKYVVITNTFSSDRMAIEEGISTFEPNGVVSHTKNKESKQVATAQQSVEFMKTVGIKNTFIILKEDIRSGKISSRITGEGYFCCESEDESDIRLIVREISSVIPARNVLWVGSVGLAGILASISNPILTILGSVHLRSVRQARLLTELGLASTIQIEVDKWKENPQKQRDLAVSEAEAVLRRGQNALLAMVKNKRFISDKFPNDDMNGFLNFLVDVSRDILGRMKLGGICVTGGDCAVRLVQRTKANGIRLIKEIQEGITLVQLNEGPFDGLSMITKAGGFGGERALIHANEYLLNEKFGSRLQLPLL
jgi:uncharacterized protein YgbK (DUF1537 family)